MKNLFFTLMVAASCLTLMSCGDDDETCYTCVNETLSIPSFEICDGDTELAGTSIGDYVTTFESVGGTCTKN